MNKLIRVVWVKSRNEKGVWSEGERQGERERERGVGSAELNRTYKSGRKSYITKLDSQGK